MYIAVKGGSEAIENSRRLRVEDRRGNREISEIDVRQIELQLGAAVDRVMTEGSLYDRELAALAIKQTGGDIVEAIVLVRAYRSTIPRLYYSEPMDSSKMAMERRISASFKDLPGGQLLGPTFDYSHRLLDFELMDVDTEPVSCPLEKEPVEDTMPRVLDDMLGRDGVVEREVSQKDGAMGPVGDLTMNPIEFPANRDVRLQTLARTDEGFIVSLAYSTMRGFGDNHGFVGELRRGRIPVEICPDELGFVIEIGDSDISECETAGWPRAVTHPRLPRIRACPIRAPGSSDNGLAAQRYTLCTTRTGGRG